MMTQHNSAQESEVSEEWKEAVVEPLWQGDSEPWEQKLSSKTKGVAPLPQHPEPWEEEAEGQAENAALEEAQVVAPAVAPFRSKSQKRWERNWESTAHSQRRERLKEKQSSMQEMTPSRMGE